jgi:hypothetical protein
VVLIAAVALFVAVPMANATVQRCRCYVDTKEAVIVKDDLGTGVWVWVTNTCRSSTTVLVTVVAYDTEGNRHLSSYPVRFGVPQRTVVRVPFDSLDLDFVSLWFATPLAGGRY